MLTIENTVNPKGTYSEMVEISTELNIYHDSEHGYYFKYREFFYSGGSNTNVWHCKKFTTLLNKINKYVNG